MNQLINKKTFIVDDDVFWVAILNKLLNDIGFTNIETFSNGKDCIENLDLKPELIFLDYQMEALNGIEVLKEIKKYNPKIEVIFCTAIEDISIAADALQYGSFDYLLKSNATKKELNNLIIELEKKQN